MPHLHLSLQHGDDLILKRMKRRHSRADALRFVETVRRLRPDVVFGADLIAGFPTEDEAMFARSLSIVAECGLTFLHVFPFSPRPGTPAARMPQVDRARRQGARRAAPRGGRAALARHLAAERGRDAPRPGRARRRRPHRAFHARPRSASAGRGTSSPPASPATRPAPCSPRRREPLFSPHDVVPGAAQREAVRCKPGTPRREDAQVTAAGHRCGVPTSRGPGSPLRFARDDSVGEPNVRTGPWLSRRAFSAASSAAAPPRRTGGDAGDPGRRATSTARLLVPAAEVGPVALVERDLRRHHLDLHQAEARRGGARRVRGHADQGRPRPRHRGRDHRRAPRRPLRQGDRRGRGQGRARRRDREDARAGRAAARHRPRPEAACRPRRRRQRHRQDHHHRQARGQAPRRGAERLARRRRHVSRRGDRAAQDLGRADRRARRRPRNRRRRRRPRLRCAPRRARPRAPTCSSSTPPAASRTRTS